jgi:uncharacterized Zn-finger protein
MKLLTNGETTITTDLVTSIRPSLQHPHVFFAAPRGDNQTACRYCKGTGKDHTWATAATCPHCGGSGVAAAEIPTASSRA